MFLIQKLLATLKKKKGRPRKKKNTSATKGFQKRSQLSV